MADAGTGVIDYQIRVSAPANARANTDLGRFVLHRRVRREDIAQATRINLFYSSQDPEMFAGQTFLETSVKAPGLLRSRADVPYVIGTIDGEDPLGGIGALIRQVGAQSVSGKSGPAPLAGLASVFSAAGAHAYYRGSLRRVESAPVLLRVLLNGEPVSLPALHAQGKVVNGDKSIEVQFWWLDSRLWPLALKWSLVLDGHVASEQITNIDLPPQADDGADSAGAGTGANRCYGNPLPAINGLAVHYTGGPGSGEPYVVANNRCVNTWNGNGASAHFAIAADGTVMQFIPTNFSAFAQGSPANEHWLNVEIDNPGKDPPDAVKANDKQIEEAQKLFAWVCRTFSIRPQVAAGHLCVEKLRNPAAKAYDDLTRQVCAYGSLSTQFSTDEKVAQNSRGLSCHRWLEPYVKSCPGYGLLGQLTEIADGATRLVGG